MGVESVSRKLTKQFHFILSPHSFVGFFIVNQWVNNNMSFKIVNIILPNTKESERCPNKNRVLRKYTLDFLERELPTIEDENTVAIVWELRNEKVPVDTDNDNKYSFKINALFVPDEYSNDMKPLMKWADKKIKGDICIQLLYTQPKRRAGLLKDLVQSVLDNPCKLTVTAAEMPLESWRVIINNNWFESIRHIPEGQRLQLYDGAGYAWHSDLTSRCLWKHGRRKAVIKNVDVVVDIDYPAQLTEWEESIK